MLFRHHLEIDSCSIKPLSGTTLKDTGKGESSQWAELWAVYMLIHFVWKETWPYLWLFTNWWAIANELTRLGDFGHDWKIGEKDIWGRNAWIPLSKCVPCECSSKDDVSRGEVQWSSRQGSLFYGQPASFPSHPFSPSGPMIKVAMVAEMEIIHGLDDIDFQSPVGYICIWVPARPAAETNTEPNWYSTIPQDDQPVTWWQVDYPGPLPSWKGKYFVFSRIDTYSDNEFAFQVHSASTETTIHGLTKCLAHS